MSPVATLWCIGLLGCVTAVTTPAPAQALRIELSALKSECVIGEPVVLSVTVWNESESEIPAWIDLLSNQIQIWIARDDAPFVQYVKGVGAIPLVIPEVRPIAPGGSKVYVIRVLARFRPARARRLAAQLAFPEVGEYAIKARYPLYPDRKMFESNTIRIQICERTGVEAQIWAQIDEPRFLCFLQTGEYWGEGREHALKAAELLTSFPDSRYHAALRYALGQDYHTRRWDVPGSDDVEHDKLYRRALALEEELLLNIPRSQAALERRLDLRRVEYHFPEYTPIHQVMKEATRQTGVSLKLGAGISRSSRFRSDRKDVSLRQFMQTLIDPGRSTWVRDGEGYRLIAMPERSAVGPTDTMSGKPMP